MQEIERMLALLKRPTRLWRVDEAAFLCDCDRTSLYRAIQTGRLGQTPQKRIPHSEVVKYLGGYDPFVEFANAIGKFDGQTGADKPDTFLEKVAELEAKIEKLEQMTGESGPKSQASREAA